MITINLLPVNIISLGNASTNNSQAGKIYSIDGVFPTICACTHGYAIGYILDNSDKIIKVNIPQEVKVRKHEVDISKLQKLLREHKIYSNNEIAKRLDIKKTTVDHWFRTDKCFSIPDENIWLKLKELLHIKTDEFDKSIMEFEYRFGVYEKSERCYLIDGLCPTITTSDDIKIITLSELN